MIKIYSCTIWRSWRFSRTRANPDILSRPFNIVKSISKLFELKFLPATIEMNKRNENWYDVKELNYLRRLLNSI